MLIVVCQNMCFLFDKVVAVERLFLIFSVLVANPKELIYTVANPARGLLNRRNSIKRECLASPHAARTEEIYKKKHRARITKRTKKTDAQTCIT